MDWEGGLDRVERSSYSYGDRWAETGAMVLMEWFVE